jgi:hypothetical protein
VRGETRLPKTCQCLGTRCKSMLFARQDLLCLASRRLLVYAKRKPFAIVISKKNALRWELKPASIRHRIVMWSERRSLDAKRTALDALSQRGGRAGTFTMLPSVRFTSANGYSRKPVPRIPRGSACRPLYGAKAWQTEQKSRPPRSAVPVGHSPPPSLPRLGPPFIHDAAGREGSQIRKRLPLYEHGDSAGRELLRRWVWVWVWERCTGWPERVPKLGKRFFEPAAGNGLNALWSQMARTQALDLAQRQPQGQPISVLQVYLSSSLRCSPVSLGTCSPREGQAAPLEKLTRRRFRGVQSIYTSLISGTTRGRGDDSHVVAGIMGACRAWNLRRLWSLTTTPQFCVSLSLC